MGIGAVEQVDIERLLDAGGEAAGSEVKYQALLAAIDSSYALYKIHSDPEGQPAGYVFVEVNAAFERRLGVARETVIGKDITATRFVAEYTGIDWRGLLEQTARDRLARTVEKQSALWERWFQIAVFSPLEGYIALLFSDITAQKEAKQPRECFDVHQDPLTGLSSRQLLEDRLMSAILQAKRTREQLAVAIFTVDNLSGLDAAYGQAALNELLREMARRIVSCLRQSDTVARLNEDSFALILPAVKSRTFAVLVANRVLEKCSQPFYVQTAAIRVTGSICLCFFPQDQVNFAMTVDREVVAMYLTKRGKFTQACLSI